MQGSRDGALSWRAAAAAAAPPRGQPAAGPLAGQLAQPAAAHSEALMRDGVAAARLPGRSRAGATRGLSNAFPGPHRSPNGGRRSTEQPAAETQAPSNRLGGRRPSARLQEPPQLCLPQSATRGMPPAFMAAAPGAAGSPAERSKGGRATRDSRNVWAAENDS